MATGGPVRPAEEPEEEEEEEEAAEEEEEEEEYTFLPLVHDIIKWYMAPGLRYSIMDKDSQDVYRELNELKNKFQAMRKLVENMAGIEMSPEQQQQHLESLKEQVQTKSDLLQKYKSLCMFEIPKE
ncbi:hypothetical protein FKM82_027930 [Ascaphus truei]|uniref:mediator of RNA polymerase II transcription subunit 9 isoform X1 n=1 Tax=Ascaphus truei TaxID=8439 RepID=UPI003F598ADF